METATRPIHSVDDLVAFLATQSDTAELFIQLNYGARSYKHINYDRNSKRFDVFNSIDGSWQRLSHSGIEDDSLTNIGHAMRVGAFYAELPDVAQKPTTRRR